MAAEYATSDVLERLLQESSQRVAKVEAVHQEKVQEDDLGKQIEIEYVQAAKARRKRNEVIREKILNPDFTQLEHDAQQYEGYLAGAVEGLQEATKVLGESFINLAKPEPADQALIDGLKQELEVAKTELETAKTKKNWFGARDAAVKDVEANITDLNVKLAEAVVMAERNAARRLSKARIDEAMQRLEAINEQLVTTLGKRRGSAIEQRQIFVRAKTEVFRMKEGAARIMKEADTKLTELEDQLRHEIEALDGYDKSDPEYVVQSERVSSLSTQVEDLRTRRNLALADFEEQEKALVYFEKHESAHRTSENALAMWIVTLTIGIKNRRTLFASQLAQMQSSEGQERASLAQEVGDEADRSGLEYMIRSEAASQNTILKKLEHHKMRMEDIMALVEGGAEAQQQFYVRFQEVIESVKKNSGFDPTKAFRFHWEKDGDAGSDESEEK